MRVLVTYATRHGTTKGIAERIATTLEHHGLEVTVSTVSEAGPVDRYDAFVIGGAAYMTHWLSDATSFVKRHQAVLTEHPVWLFSCGPTGVEPSAAKRDDVLKASIPREFADLERSIHPRGTKVFYGAYDPDAPAIGLAEGFMNRLTKLIPAAKEGIPSGDFREWPEIDGWAEGIAASLQPAAVG